MSNMKLFFPQWQGSGGSKASYYGAYHIIELLKFKKEFAQVELSSDEELVTEHGIIGYRQILQQLKSVVSVIDQIEPNKILTIGGDCSVAIGPASYLNKRYDGDLVMVWIDAHADLNTPTTSPSQRFYGMPLRVLLGEGEEAILEACYSTLSPEQTILVGLSDPDPAEVDYIHANNIKVLSAESLMQDSKLLANHIRAMNKRYVYIHIDFDILLCKAFSGHDGARVIAECLEQVRNESELVGFSTAGYSEQVPVAVEALMPILDVGLGM